LVICSTGPKHLKAGEFTGSVFPGGVRPGHVSPGGAAPYGTEKLVQDSPRTFGQDFYRAIPPVPHPAGYPGLAGGALNEVTKTNTLNPSFEVDVQAGWLFIRHLSLQ
jgi:hypothetical protein